MKRLVMSLVVALAALSLVLVGCSQPAPPPAPTKAPEPAKPAAAPTAAPAAPTAAPKAAEPTKAPAAAPAPTAVPAKKVDYPVKGKAVMLVVPYAPGGSRDVGARLLAPYLEKELGTPVEVVNKGGAGGQIGLTDVALSKPDGHTLGYITFPANFAYLDPQRKAEFKRESFIAVGNHTLEPLMVAVRADSPYKNLKDVMDAAKAKPDSIKGGTNGVGSGSHLLWLDIRKTLGTNFRIVHMGGDAEQHKNLLGGDLDLSCAGVRAAVPFTTAGTARVLAIFDKARSEYYPDVPTAAQQGYNVNAISTAGWVIAAGTPKEVVDLLASALKRAIQNPEHIKKMAEAGATVKYMSPEEYAPHWVEMEKLNAPLIDMVIKGQ